MRNSRLALAIAGSRASDTRGQAPLRPQRRPPQPQYPGQLTPLSSFFAEVVCEVGATPPRTAALPPRTATSPPPNGGNCTNRGVTRRRHADRMLLMVQNPHRQPEIHPGAVGGGSESTGALRDTSLATAPAGDDPTTSKQISHVISLGHFSRSPENVAIPTMWIQHFN